VWPKWGEPRLYSNEKTDLITNTVNDGLAGKAIPISWQTRQKN